MSISTLFSPRRLAALATLALAATCFALFTLRETSSEAPPMPTARAALDVGVSMRTVSLTIPQGIRFDVGAEATRRRTDAQILFLCGPDCFDACGVCELTGFPPACGYCDFCTRHLYDDQAAGGKQARNECQAYEAVSWLSEALFDNTSTTGGGPLAFSNGSLVVEVGANDGFAFDLQDMPDDASCEVTTTGFACSGFGLAPGEEAPFPFAFTPSKPGTFDMKITVETELFDPNPANNEVTITVTVLPTTEVHGQKFWDADGDGVFDPEETGLDGVEIEWIDSDGTPTDTLVTESMDLDGDGDIDPHTEQGLFWVDGVPEGTYGLREIVPSGNTQTFPADEAGHTVTYDGITPLDTLFRFGNTQPLFELCGRKFLDVDGDGIQGDGLEYGLGGVEIELLDEAGNVIATTNTGRAEDVNGDGLIDVRTEMGRFCFEGLPRGRYTVREVVPDRFTQTFPGGEGTHTVDLGTGSIPPIVFGNQPPPDDSLHFEADFGDLPDPRLDLGGAGCPGCYPTLGANAGPFHILGDLWLGPFVDSENDGQPTAAADGDDMRGDDEDGLNRLSLNPDGSLTLELIVSDPTGGGGFVDAWVDVDEDGRLAHPAEQILVSAPVLNGLNVVATRPGLTFTDLPGFLRFRISSVGGLPPIGGAADGEVEDYFFAGADFGDAPGFIDPNRPEMPGGYPTSLAQDGARHVVLPDVRLGDHIDAQGTLGTPDEITGSLDAREDDEEQSPDDEDGLSFLAGVALQSEGDLDEIHDLTRADTVRFLPLPSTPGRLDAWLDWNRDGDWADAGEQVVVNVQIDPSMREEDALTFVVPVDAALGFTYGRFRFSRLGGLSYDGAAPDGEVEDYLFRVGEASTGTAAEGLADVPRVFALHPNYPNPFNPTTLIRYALPRSASVRLVVFDALGRVVRTLVVAEQAAGRYEHRWDARNDAGRAVASGVYLYRLEAGAFAETRRMVLLR